VNESNTQTDNVLELGKDEFQVAEHITKADASKACP
jgi:hypothetical protein